MPIRHRLSRNHVVYDLSRRHPPALEIGSGDEVVLETWDARTGTIRRDDDLLDHAHPLGTNPATGPIWVDGTEPGEVLAVRILRIELAEEGFVAVKARQGLLADRAADYATRMLPIRDGVAWFSERISLPLRPMVGVIGTTPDGDGASTGLPGRHGGNMDNRLVGEGARVYLPVLVPGALLGLGDVHAAMGDGEITFLGLEIRGEVTVQVERLRQGPAGYRGRPLVETADHWVTTGEHTEMVQSVRQAAEEMAHLLQVRLGLSFAEAYMLMGAAADVQICQCCQPGVFPVTSRAVVSKRVAP